MAEPRSFRRPQLHSELERSFKKCKANERKEARYRIVCIVCLLLLIAALVFVQWFSTDRDRRPIPWGGAMMRVVLAALLFFFAAEFAKSRRKSRQYEEQSLRFVVMIEVSLDVDLAASINDERRRGDFPPEGIKDETQALLPFPDLEEMLRIWRGPRRV